MKDNPVFTANDWQSWKVKRVSNVNTLSLKFWWFYKTFGKIHNWRVLGTELNVGHFEIIESKI